jgi:hypothetical protein
MVYETNSDLIVFVKWFDRVSVELVCRGQADRAGQAARGMAHFLRRLHPEMAIFPTTEKPSRMPHSEKHDATPHGGL